MEIKDYNKRNNPSMFRKIRKIAYNKKQNLLIQGITIPEMIASQFVNVNFTIRCNDTQIILESGCPMARLK